MPINRASLNDAQWEAVTSCDGPSLVIAGAGSGKTRVLTYKIAYLIEQGMAPWNILALTFTNKAAREMNGRIAQVVGEEAAHRVWSGTFHSIFAKILRHEAAALSYTTDYTIYDTSDSRSLIKSIIKERGLDEKQYKAQTVGGRISEAKNALLLPEAYLSDSGILRSDRTAGIGETGHIYADYCQRCRAANAMDFDDLLLNTFLLFRDRPEILQKYKERFRYILVDEYQDTNAAQHRIISQLAPAGARICVVGDDAQSIYGFRGARIDNILGFQEQYPSARLIKLERNYRSTQNIVDAANSLISHNKEQIPKKVYSTAERGTPLRVICAYSDKEESLKVTGEVRRLHRVAHLDYNDIALLYRTNAQSRSFEEALRAANVPYRIYGGLSFYQRKEIKDTIAYFRLICNPHDEEAFKRIINYPARGIGATTMSKLQLAATEHAAPLWDVAGNPASYGIAFNKGTAAKINAFIALIDSFRQQLQQTDGAALAAAVIRQSGIGADIMADRTPEGLSRQENIQELLSAIQANEDDIREETGRQTVPISAYLSQVALLTDADQHDDGTPKVTLMTVHAAKGLEFDAVFVTGLENDLFPNANARFYPKEMEEDRRLFYVAITRAKRFCYLTYAKSRYRFGSMDFADPSPFLDDIDAQYLEREEGITTRNLWRNDREQSRTLQWQQTATSIPGPKRQLPFASIPTVQPPMRTPQSYRPDLCANFDIGDTVEHERFGRGTVAALEGAGDSAKATVEFVNAGRKTLLLKFAKIKKL